MTGTTARRDGLRAERGFTMIEMLVAMLIMVAVTGAIFGLMNPAQGTFQAQPEVADMQQRMRVGVDSLYRDLLMAGAGAYQGTNAGALYNVTAPVMPYRSGGVNDDPAQGVFYRNDAISVVYVPTTAAQTTINADIVPGGTDFNVTPEACSTPRTCGFTADMHALLLDLRSGNADRFTVTQVDAVDPPGVPLIHLHHDGALATKYDKGAALTQAQFRTYYLKQDALANTFELRQFDGFSTDLPVVDNVVKLAFDYFGEAAPPQLLPPPKALSDPKGPWTTYGPKPPLDDRADDTWPLGENCAFRIDPLSGLPAPRLASLGDAVGQVKLDRAVIDGSGDQNAWCADDTKANRFDADLLRIRRVRVTLRVQVALASMRGPAGALFVHGGVATSPERFVPDQEIRFDVSPRNMNLGR